MLEIFAERLQGPNTTFWPVFFNENKIGKVTSAVYSPRLKKNIALAMVDISSSNLDTELKVEIDGSIVNSKVINKPFFLII